MDKATNGEKAKAVAMRFFGKESISWDDARGFFKERNERTIGFLDDAINSYWTWGDRKSFLIMFKSLIVINSFNQSLIVETLEALEQVEKAVSLLGEQLEKTQTKSKELDDALSKIRSMFAEPRIAKVASIMENIEKQIENSKTASDSYNV